MRFKPGASPSTRSNDPPHARRASEGEPPASEHLSRQVRPAPRPARSRRGLRAPRGVKYAEPNFIRTYDSTTPERPRASSEHWALPQPGPDVNGLAGTAGADIGAPAAWDITQGSTSVTVVGVVDTGVDYNHSDLAPNIWTNSADPPGGGDQDGDGLDRRLPRLQLPRRTRPNPDPIDDVGHGTHVAGIIAAAGEQRHSGVAGVSWQSKIAALRACDAIGCDDAAIADAFTYAGIKGFRVVNASLSSPTQPDHARARTTATRSRRRSPRHPNTLVRRGGRQRRRRRGRRQRRDNALLSVQLHVREHRVRRGDGRERQPRDVLRLRLHVSRPGRARSVHPEHLEAQGRSDQYAYESGTSQATAMVSGAVALDLSKNPARRTATLRNDLLVNTVAKPQLSGKVVTWWPAGRGQHRSGPAAPTAPTGPRISASAATASRT